MKKTIKFLVTLILLSGMLITSCAMAQQPVNARPANSMPAEIADGNKAATYSYKLYTAPGNAFGYDILRNGKPVFHQFVLTFISDDGIRSAATKPQAEKAAALAIEKIKKGMPALITSDEMKKILSQ